MGIESTLETGLDNTMNSINNEIANLPIEASPKEILSATNDISNLTSKATLYTNVASIEKNLQDAATSVSRA